MFGAWAAWYTTGLLIKLTPKDVVISFPMFGVAQGGAACLGWGALHDRTMIFLAFPDYGQNLCKVLLTGHWVEAIRAAIKTVHSGGVLHSDLLLRNFVGNSSNSVKLIDFACCAMSGFSSDTMAYQEKHFMASLMVQVSFATWSARYNTGLLIKLTPKGVVFSFIFFYFLFFSVLFFSLQVTARSLSLQAYHCQC